jgi:hypothetical protein
VFVRYSFIYQVLQQFVIIPQYSQGNCAEAWQVIRVGNYTVRDILMENIYNTRVRSKSGIINILPNTSVIFH